MIDTNILSLILIGLSVIFSAGAFLWNIIVDKANIERIENELLHNQEVLFRLLLDFRDSYNKDNQDYLEFLKEMGNDNNS